MHYFPGGKGANQAVAAAKLGAPTTLIGRLGNDAFGQQLRAFLAAQASTSASCRTPPDAHTGTAVITIANADNTIVVVPGANALVSAEDVGAAPLAKGDIAVSQFEIPLPTISRVLSARTRRRRDHDPQSGAGDRLFGPELLELVDILILNETELGFLTQTELRDTDEPARFRRSGAAPANGRDRIICVTLGKRGVLALIDGEASMIAGRAVKAVDTTGAGDCFVGALAASSPAEKQSATRSNTPTPPHRSACSGWAPRLDADGGGGCGCAAVIDVSLHPGPAEATCLKSTHSSDRSRHPPPAPA